MPFYRVNGMLVHLKLAGPRSKWPAPCCARLESGERCMGISTVLCDWPLDGGGTCDAPLCEEHGLQVGEDRHLCPLHAPRRGELPGQAELFEA